MNDREIIEWLLEGDISIQYQVYRDLLDDDREDLRCRIGSEGWSRVFLSKQKSSGHWGDRFYQPKWISTHYTLLDLKHMNLGQNNEQARKAINLVLSKGLATDGGIPLGPSTQQRSDVCVNAMFLNYASYFRIREESLQPIVDAILNEKMSDGGFNCRTARSGAVHSSLHTTISVVEGLLEFQKAAYQYRNAEIVEAIRSAEEFILLHQLYISDRTGEIIKKDFLKLSFPSRWRYDILRALDYFQSADRPWDRRMEKAIQVIRNKRNRHRTWNMQAAHPGQTHILMEKAGQASRWNTLRVLRVFKHFDIDNPL